MASTIQEVAKKVNVSISTVSRVLNNSGYVSPETREKVIAAADELGYRQNRLAQSLRSQQTDFIGFIVPEVANEFFATLASAVEKSIYRYGYSLFLCNSAENPVIENRYIESLMGNQVRGIVLVSAGIQLKTASFRDNIPIVLIDRIGKDPKIKQCAMIESDNFNGGQIAARELIQRDAKRFVFVGDRRNMRAMDQRRQGFLQTLLEYGFLPEDCRELMLPVSASAARESVRAEWKRDPFDGLFCGTDLLAIGGIKGLNDIGVKVPDDVQVIGFDGIQLGEFTIPSLSTVRQDIPAMGRIAGEAIVAMIRGKEVASNNVLPVEFLARGSTRKG